ncbi:MAG: hypothetical protein CVU35_05850, partial [Betaproteobacteria bacterium HGW-Betaproteobacteria-8]
MLKTNLIALAAALMLVANETLFAMEDVIGTQTQEGLAEPAAETQASTPPSATDTPQANAVTSSMMMQLRPGMTKPEVQAIMGMPLTKANVQGNRWDYLYQMRQRDKLVEQRRVILEFENEALAHIQSNVIPVAPSQPGRAGTDEQPQLALDSSRPMPDPNLKLEHHLEMPYVPEDMAAEEHSLEPGSIVIEGDKMDFYLERKMRSFGNASLKKDEQSIYGDKIEYDTLNDELHVVGNTRIEFEGLKVWGPELRMQLYDSVGEMKEPSFELETQLIDIPQISTAKATNLLEQDPLDAERLASSSLDNLMSQNIEDTASYDATLRRRQSKSRGDAKTVFFEGENKKVLKSASYTTCEAGHDDWYIKASELEIDNYTKKATAWNARVEFMGVPLLYTPWIDFSYLNQRKSGFLSPTVGTTSRSGFEVQVPYYWNIAPDMDATLGVRALSKRGVQLQSEFRYLDENYSGTSSAEYLPSDSISGDNR